MGLLALLVFFHLLSGSSTRLRHPRLEPWRQIMVCSWARSWNSCTEIKYFVCRSKEDSLIILIWYNLLFPGARRTLHKGKRMKHWQQWRNWWEKLDIHHFWSWDHDNIKDHPIVEAIFSPAQIYNSLVHKLICRFPGIFLWLFPAECWCINMVIPKELMQNKSSVEEGMARVSQMLDMLLEVSFCICLFVCLLNKN